MLNKRKVEAISIVPLIILFGILVFIVSKIFDMSLTIYWLIPVLVLPGITVAIFEWWADAYRTGEIKRVRAWQGALQNEKRRKEIRITEESKRLGEELAERSKAEKRENRTLLAKESLIDNRISEISSWTNELKTLLREIRDESHGDNDLQQVHSVNLKRKERIGSQMQKQYHSKKLEAQLLRLNNSLQKQAAVDEMTHELRVDIKSRLGQIVDLCNQIVTDLTEAAVTVESGGSESLVRVLAIGKIAGGLRQALIEQGIELALPGRISDKSTPTPQFVKGMALLNAYVCIDDFSAELDMLEREFASARGPIHAH